MISHYRECDGRESDPLENQHPSEGRIVTRDEAKELYHFAYVPKPNEIGDSFTNYPAPPALLKQLPSIYPTLFLDPDLSNEILWDVLMELVLDPPASHLHWMTNPTNDLPLLSNLLRDEWAQKHFNMKQWRVMQIAEGSQGK